MLSHLPYGKCYLLAYKQNSIDLHFIVVAAEISEYKVQLKYIKIKYLVNVLSYFPLLLLMYQSTTIQYGQYSKCLSSSLLTE